MLHSSVTEISGLRTCKAESGNPSLRYRGSHCTSRALPVELVALQPPPLSNPRITILSTRSLSLKPLAFTCTNEILNFLRSACLEAACTSCKISLKCQCLDWSSTRNSASFQRWHFFICYKKKPFSQVVKRLPLLPQLTSMEKRISTHNEDLHKRGCLYLRNLQNAISNASSH